MFSCYGKQFCHLVYALTGIDAWRGDKRLRTDGIIQTLHVGNVAISFLRLTDAVFAQEA
jgi:hypothetical protein